MYTLYYATGACSLAVHAVLYELNAPFNVMKVDMMKGQHKTPEYLKLNPRGQVPLLVEDGQAFAEGGAILVYLLEKHPNFLLPPVGTKERGTALQWLMYGNSSLHPMYSAVFGAARTFSDEALRFAFCDAMIDRINNEWQYIEKHLENRSYLCGDDCTIGDILLTVFAPWGKTFQKPIIHGPRTQALFERVRARESFAKALAAEMEEQKAA